MLEPESVWEVLEHSQKEKKRKEKSVVVDFIKATSFLKRKWAQKSERTKPTERSRDFLY